MLEAVDDLTVANWVVDGYGPVGSVSCVVPAGFASYVRVCHPVESGGPGSAWVDWATVAAATGRVAHPLMQWESISVGTGGRPDWDGGRPRTGSLPVETFEKVVRTIAAVSGPVGPCTFLLWEGWGGLTAELERAFDQPLPRVHLPGRDNVLLTGDLADADIESRFGWRSRPQLPQLIWPADRSWAIGTEVDFDSSIVAGSSELTAALLADPELDAWPVAAADYLTIDADEVNGWPRRDSWPN